MSTNNTGTGGVRNLLAIFENKVGEQSTSPPSRGRSPSGSIASSHSRPVSKVRASFVAVERPGEAGGPSVWGLRKMSDINMDGASESAISHEETVSSSTRGDNLGAILKGSPFEPTFPSPVGSNSETKTLKTGGAVASMNGKSVETAETSDVADKTASMIEKMQQPESKNPPPKTKLQTTGTAELINPPPTRIAKSKLESPTTPTGNGPVAKPRGGSAKIQAVMDSANEAKDSKSPSNTAGSGTFPRPRGGGAKIQAVTESAQKAEDSRRISSRTTGGPVAKPRGGVAKIQAVTNSANEAKESRAAPNNPSTGPIVKPRGGMAKIQAVMKSAEEAKQARLSMTGTEDGHPDLTKTGAHTQEHQNGSTRSPTSPKGVKAAGRPRSPTRPANLPASVTAPTAASAAKKDVGHEESKSHERKSVSKAPLRVANSTTASSLAKKTSRASLNMNERPRSRVSLSKPADEGFLARMMRPTASSIQKAHEKVQVASPPQKRRMSASQKDLIKKPSRKSLNTSETALDENKENLKSATQEAQPMVSGNSDEGEGESKSVETGAARPTSESQQINA